MKPDRSWLFCPADRPERFDRALASGADRVVLDLEDAVLPEAKVGARASLAAWLNRAAPRSAVVRVNAVGTPWHDEDVVALADRPGLAGIMLPKAENAEVLAGLRMRLARDAILVALVESLRGFASVRHLANVQGVQRLAFGSVDFCLEAGIKGYGEELNGIRTQLVVESALAGIGAPIEGVTVALKDTAQLTEDIDRAQRFGFAGKLCIHPTQVELVNRGFLPSEAEVEWARRVVAACATGGGAIVIDGKLVDRPVRLRAEAILTAVA